MYVHNVLLFGILLSFSSPSLFLKQRYNVKP